MKFIREWSNPLSLVVVVITIVTTIVITSRALVTKNEFDAAIQSTEKRIDCVVSDTEAKIKTSQAAQERYFEEYIKNAAAWAADNAAEKTIKRWLIVVEARERKRAILDSGD
jgi:hypothetical protein